MIHTLYWGSSGQLETDLSTVALADAIQDSDGLLWVDMSEESQESCEPILTDVFAFHPLAVDDALEERHLPRVDDWDDYLYLVLHAIEFDAEAAEPLGTVELDVFLGMNYLVTYHTKAIPALEHVRTACMQNRRQGAALGESDHRKGAVYLLYRLADELVTETFPVLDAIDDAIDRIEDQIFGEPTKATLQQVFTLRRAVLRLRRVLGPERDLFGKLARGGHAVVGHNDEVFFRDIFDHMVRLHEIGESLRELTASALDTYLSVVNNRMNEVMKVLTVITTLFMPLSFLAGFFGMNFFQPAVPLAGWTSRTAFAATLAAMVVLPAAMGIWLQRRGWM